MTYINKTQQTAISPEDYLKKNFPRDTHIQSDTFALIDIYTKATKSSCVMWNKIFGFGKYHYKDSRGGKHTHLATGFAISATGFTLYNMMGWDMHKKEITELGKCKVSGKSCLTIKSIKDIKPTILGKIIKDSLVAMRREYDVEK